jgi:beta-lactamase superfamily II metal-dependent hydrolase
MADQLLVRMYNVGLGDCIYLQVPDQDDLVHILIDCGNKFEDIERLGECVADMKADLPNAGEGQKRLDLLVVTHPHEDHHKGFEEEYFGDIKIDRIWLSPAYDRLNPQMQGFQALQAAAQRGLQGLAGQAVGDLQVEISELLSLTKDEAIDMLCNTLPEKNGIEPLFVTADTPAEQLRIFNDPAITLKVLNPMSAIDDYYLGGDGLISTPTALEAPELADRYQKIFQPEAADPPVYPKNISSRDFDRLRSGVQSNALALANIAGHAANNLSVVLLLEWKDHRLLFPGDAEWKKAFNGEFKPGRTNGAWNVMWKERQAELSQALNFLKIGHHGSDNASPWMKPDPDTGKAHPINDILDHLLPLPAEGQKATAYAVASTNRTSRWPTIPDPDLMEELGKRVANQTSAYREDPARVHVPANTPQPQRTDLESQLTPTPEVPVKCIEVRFPV